MEYNNIRPIPNREKGIKRYSFFQAYQNITPIKPDEFNKIGLSSGNKKTGQSGKFFQTIYVWNLPPVITCPGASEWCKTHCYNFDEREDVYPLKEWCENLWMFNNKKDELKKNISNQLSCSDEKTAVRLHSSGDFFSMDYISFWIEIATQFPNVFFWAYTRSWAVEGLKECLNLLAKLDNVQLFASFDDSMTSELNYFPKSLVFSRLDSLKKFSIQNNCIICPEQFGILKTCADCGACIKKQEKDILFLLH